MSLTKIEEEIKYHHGKCDIEYKTKNGLVYMKVNDLVIFENVNIVDEKNFQLRNLENGLEKAHDILVRTPQLITVHGYSKLITENSHPNTRIPPLELLRGLGILKLDTVTGFFYTLDGNFEYVVVNRGYTSYDEINWADWYGVYTITKDNHLYKVRGILKNSSEFGGIAL